MTLPITSASLRSADADQEKRDYSGEDFGATMGIKRQIYAVDDEDQAYLRGEEHGTEKT
jgi:hypothetical protein